MAATLYLDKLEHYIDGQWVAASSGKGSDVVNPATNQPIAKLSHASKADLDKALRAAEKGFATWRRVSAYERGKILKKAADLLRSRVDEIARHLTLEQGKVVAEAKVELMGSADIIEWFAEEGRRAYGRIIPARADGVRNMVIMEPVGIVAGFSPWNFPVSQAARKIGGALAAGCSIIIKCPEETPASPIGFVKCFHDAGVPPGVINLVYGVPAEISEYLIPHPVDPQDLVHGLGAGRQETQRACRAAHEARDDGTRWSRARLDLRRRRDRSSGDVAARHEDAQRRPSLRLADPLLRP